VTLGPYLLCIDANVYLSFLQRNTDELELLSIFEKLLQTNKVSLLVPQQVVDEFDIKRDDVLKGVLDRLKGGLPKIEIAACFSEYAETKKLLGLKGQYEGAHRKLIERFESEIQDRTLKAEVLVRKLFELGRRLPHGRDECERAANRRALGRPPEGTGDSLIWESVLADENGGRDMHFVSDDTDFCSSLDRDLPDSFLKKEWSAKGSQLILHRRLSAFLAATFPEMKRAGDVERTFLIEDLLQSGSFIETHRAIEKLNALGAFSALEANRILAGSLANGQVSRILDDADVESFLRRLFSEQRDSLDSSVANTLDLLWNPPPPSEDDDDLPF